MAGSISTTGKTDYCTPDYIATEVRTFFGGCVDLDPCSNPGSRIFARRNIMLEDPPVVHVTLPPMRAITGINVKGDGLLDPWAPDRTVFVNPPYGDGIDAWIYKGWNFYRADNLREILYLIPAAVETKWWQTLILKEARGICFLDHRPHFVGAEHGINRAVGIVYFGERPAVFQEQFSRLGYTYKPYLVHGTYQPAGLHLKRKRKTAAA